MTRVTGELWASKVVVVMVPVSDENLGSRVGTKTSVYTAVPMVPNSTDAPDGKD